MWRKNGMPAILYPLPKIVRKFNTIVFTGGTAMDECQAFGSMMGQWEKTAAGSCGKK
jgi:hypothetical protein